MALRLVLPHHRIQHQARIDKLIWSHSMGMENDRGLHFTQQQLWLFILDMGDMRKLRRYLIEHNKGLNGKYQLLLCISLRGFAQFCAFQDDDKKLRSMGSHLK